jgi:hypothetical protein
MTSLLRVANHDARERKQTMRFEPEDHRTRWENWDQVHSAQQKVLTDMNQSQWINALKMSNNPAPLTPDPLARDSNGLWKRKDVLNRKRDYNRNRKRDLASAPLGAYHKEPG